MFYSKEEKEFLGRYFKYTRNQNEMTIKKITSTGICGFKTYKRIEEGKVSHNEELYDHLLEFFHIDFDILLQLRKIQPFIQELYDACEWYDNKKIGLTIKKIKQNLTHISKKPIIRELFKSLEIIDRFYVSNQYLNEKEITQTLELIHLWNNELSSLLVEVCGKSDMNYVLSFEILDLLKPYTMREDCVSKYWYANDCVVRVNNTEAIDIYMQLFNHYNQHNNLLRKARILMDLHALYRDTDYKKAEEYTVLMKEMVIYESLPKDMKEALYYNLGMYYYLKGDYENALPNYEKSNEINEDMLSVLFICACRSRLNCIIGYDFHLDETHALVPYLIYFKMKANGESEKELEKNIFEHLIEILVKEKYEQPFWSMFSYELSELVKKTRNYKKYHDYQEKMQFATKKAA